MLIETHSISFILYNVLIGKHFSVILNCFKNLIQIESAFPNYTPNITIALYSLLTEYRIYLPFAKLSPLYSRYHDNVYSGNCANAFFLLKHFLKYCTYNLYS